MYNLYNILKMKVAIVGTGYVGLVSGTCFSEMGIDVTCVDIDEQKINNLRKAQLPIYEPGLEELVINNCMADRLHFTTNLIDVINDVEIVFCAVGTPADEDGSADLKYVIEVARTVGKSINHYVCIVTKSTVPVGTSALVKKIIQEELDARGVTISFDVASNPEFLKEGAAIKDFMSPDRIVVGVENERAKILMMRLYRPFMVVSDRLIFTDISSAEMIKYAANSMLATRISFMNDIANLCEIVGADVNMVRKGIGSDTRIGKKFLYAGCGYGGSCFPKDVKALIKTAEHYGYDMQVLKSVESVNKKQKSVLYDKFRKHYSGNVSGKTVAIWGLSFKPETDDMREAPALVLIDMFIKDGIIVKVYDPIAIDECKRRIGNKVIYCKDMYEATVDADALLLVTEWKVFRMPSWSVLKKSMNQFVILDGRNIYDKNELSENGFAYYKIG